MSSKDNEKIIKLCGRIDSDNASDVEKNILAGLEGCADCRVIMDAQELAYISSAGLRTILRLRKSYPEVKIINVNSDVYEILDMTGFTEMLPVEKAYRTVSVEGCDEIGSGANGRIYRIDKDNVVKVFTNDNALEDIRHEREAAKLALILGIPTAISYDVVKVGNSYGSVFELLDAKPFNRIIVDDPSKIGWCVSESVKLLKKIHAIRVPEGKLPDARVKFRSWIEALRPHIPSRSYKKLLSIAGRIPFDDHMIHGDFHTKNLMLLDDEVLLIDMETIAMGHPVFEFAAMYDSYVGFSEYDHDHMMAFQGYDREVALKIWRRSLEVYFETDDFARLNDIEDRSRIIGYTRMLDYVIRHRNTETPEEKAEVEYRKEKLNSLLEKVDTVVF